MKAVLSQSLILLGWPVACAVVGFLIGRLIRYRPSEVERSRPRIAASTAFLIDAQNRGLSAHTRTRCAFDCIYFCCAELAEVQGRQMDTVAPPIGDVVQIGLAAIGTTRAQLSAVELLAEWVIAASPALPNMPVDTACKLADEIRNRTITVLQTLGNCRRRGA